MSNVTVGPWRVLTVTQEEIKANHDAIPTGASHYSGDYIAVLGSDGSVVCDNAGYYAQPITKQDAPLIAAAPELLEALEFVIKRFGPCQKEYIFSKRLALDKARAAIAKAKGEQP